MEDSWFIHAALVHQEVDYDWTFRIRTMTAQCGGTLALKRLPHARDLKNEFVFDAANFIK